MIPSLPSHDAIRSCYFYFNKPWPNRAAIGTSNTPQAPHHLQTQGKIERWHQTLKNRVLSENYYLPGYLENQIDAFVKNYNHQRYHESLGNVTTADVYFGRAKAIKGDGETASKKQTIQNRRLNHQRQAA